ncbi:tandem-95 repeat protein, partial [Vibrio sp. FNV 38]|nr:tandem-95 repeat protein [Vibrio sp. FNV 38]
MSNASDVEGDDLTASNLSVDGNADVTVNSDGSFTITPDADWNGDIDISFDVSDGNNIVQAQADLTVNPVNDLPQPQDQAFSMEEDGTLTFTDADLLTGATDIDGDDLSVEGVSYSGTDGILTDNGNGTYSFAPNENFNGDVEFSFDVNDGTDTVSANIDVSVTPINDAPTVDGNLSYTVNEDGEITISQEQLLSNASDVEGDDLTASNLSVDGNADVTVNSDGSFTITPDADWNGDIDISFDVSDGNNIVQAQADLTVNPVNDLPQPQDQAFSMEEDGTLIFTDADLLTGATDIDGDELSVEGVSYSGTDGILTDNGNGTYSFAPNENFNGDVEFSFDVNDGTGVVSANIDISVIPVNDPPVAGSTSYTMNEDGKITISSEQLLANSSDIEGEVAIDAVDYSGSDGLFTDNGDGTFTFAPSQDFNGEVNLDVTVIDEEGASVTTTAGINVIPVDDAPVVGETNIGGTEDTAIVFTQEMLLQNATDIDSDELTAFNLQIAPEFGTVVDNDDGTFTFTPTEDYNGDVPFTFKVDDNDGETTEASGKVNMAAVNDVPVLAETSYEVNEDGSILITESSLLDNATDVDGDQLSITNITSDENGTVVQQSNGDWLYTPNNDYSGEARLSITVNDGTVDAVFDAPVSVTADADAPSLTVSLQDMTLAEFGITTDSTLTGWHTDNASGWIEVNYSNVYGAGWSNGKVIELEAHYRDESNLYSDLNVDAGEVVSLSFDMSARQGSLGHDSRIDVYFEGELVDTIVPWQMGWNSFNYEFTATTDNPRLEFDSPGSNALGGLLDNISVTKVLIEDHSVPLNIESVLTDTDGSESLQSLIVGDLPDGSTITDGENIFTADGENDSADILGWNLDNLSFQGAQDFNGNVSLNVTATSVEDSNGDTASTSAALDFDIKPVNDAPEAQNQAYTIEEDGTLTFTDADLLTGATDIDGDDLSVEGVNYSGTDGILTDNGNGTYSFAPNENFNGDVEFSFDVSDGTDTVSANIDVSVTPIDDAPTVDGNLSYTVNEDGEITISQEQLLSNVSDVEGDDLTASNLSVDGNADVTVNSDGSFTITPDADWNGDIDIRFDVSDGNNIVQAQADLTVNPVNDLPQPQGQAFSMEED